MLTLAAFVLLAAAYVPGNALKAQEIIQGSQGANGPTELRHRAQSEQRRLNESELSAARAKVGWERISFSTKQVAFGSSGMAATFNGSNVSAR